MNTPRGIENNNPGNIRKSGAKWQGKIEGADAEFETFNAPEYGIRALIKNLRGYKFHGPTITKIINRWAPPGENNTAAYIDSVAKQTGLDKAAPLDLFDKGTCLALAIAITTHENGQQPYGSDVLERAWDLLQS